MIRIIKGRRRPVILVMILLLTGVFLQAQNPFRLASQNCLHLGWGDSGYQNNKNQILQYLFDNYDVIMLQEVMAQANLGAVTPGNHYYRISAVKGVGSYKEAYGFIISQNIIATSVYDYSGAGFARPPSGVLLQTGNNWTWGVNYHAIFGKVKAARQDEVRLISNVYQSFQTTMVNGSCYNRVIFGGDWNLAANEIQQQLGLNVQPTAKTSLKSNGGLSQPYDHFVWDANVITVTNVQVINIQTLLNLNNLQWRQDVSDHLGISCDVHY